MSEPKLTTFKLTPLNTSELSTSTLTTTPLGGGSKAKKKGRGYVSKFFRDLGDAAIHSPGGLYELGKAGAHDVNSVISPSRIGAGMKTHARDKSQLRPIGKGIVTQTIEDLQHPGRHPGYTALDILGLASLGGGTAVRLAAGSRAIRAGADLGEISKAFVKAPKPQARVVRIPGGHERVSGSYSKSSVTRLVQKHLDKVREAFPDTPILGRDQITRFGNAERAHREYEARIGRAPAQALRTRKLSAGQAHALRAQAEGVTIDERIAFNNAKIEAGGLKPRQERKIRKANIELESARPYLDETSGSPVITDPKLSQVFSDAKQLADERTQSLVDSGVLTPEAAAGRVTSPGEIIREALGEAPAGEGKLRGLPPKGSPSTEAQGLAKSYMEKTGQEYKAPHTYAKADPERAARIADEYEKMPDMNDPGVSAEYRAAVQRSYDAMIAETLDQYKTITDAGYKFEFPEGAYPYKSPWDAMKDLKENKHLYVFPTEEGFGSLSEAQRAHPLLTDSGIKWGGRPVTNNDLFRAVHDFFGHFKEGVGFRADGEENAWRSHSAMYSDEARKAMTSETRGQNSWVNYGPHAAANKGASELDTVYADQKAGIMPDWVVNEGRGDLADGFRVPYSERSAVSGLTKLAGSGSSGVVGKARKPGSLTNTFEGKILERGGGRNEAHQLIAESSLEAQRYLSLLHARDRIKGLAHDDPNAVPEKYRIAVNLGSLAGKTLPGAARDIITKAETGAKLSQEEIQALGSMYETVRSELFSTDVPHEVVPGIKWVDSRLLGGLDKPNPLIGMMKHRGVGKAVAGIDALNAAQKFAILYAKPAYAIPNLMGNSALALIQQGVFAPENLYNAARINSKLPSKAVHAIDEGMGEGVMHVLADQNSLKSLNSMAAGLYGKVVDRPFRRSAFLHEARRQGYKTPEEIHKLLFDQKLKDERLQVFQRANSELIDYSRLGPFEKNVIARIIFFYPWVKGSTVYTARMFGEHPAVTSIMGQLGEIGKEAQSHGLGDLPSYYEGLIRTGGTDAAPRVVNPTSATIFQTPADAARIALGLFGQGKGSESASSLLTPSLGFLDTLHSGVSGLGYNPQDESNFHTAINGLYKGLPAFQLAQRLRGKQTSKSATYSKEDALLKFLFGLTPYTVNREKLNAQAKR